MQTDVQRERDRISLLKAKGSKKRLKASKREISSEPLSPVAQSKGHTWDGCWYVLPGHLTSEPNTAGYRGLAIASVRRSIAAMAIVTGKEQVMQPAPPNPPDKEGPFLPWLETQGHPGPASVRRRSPSRRRCICKWSRHQWPGKCATTRCSSEVNGWMPNRAEPLRVLTLIRGMSGQSCPRPMKPTLTLPFALLAPPSTKDRGVA